MSGCAEKEDELLASSDLSASSFDTNDLVAIGCDNSVGTRMSGFGAETPVLDALSVSSNMSARS